MNRCTLFWRSSLRTYVSTKSSIRLGSSLRIVACNKKILSFKYIYKKNRCNKKNTILFICETNETESPMCMVMKLWTHRFWLSVSDYNRLVKRTNITCLMYSAHTSSETYNSLKSFQTTMSFQPGSSLSFIYFLVFFCASYQKSRNLHDTN